MKPSRLHLVFAAKLVLAVVMFSTLIGLVGANMAPKLPLTTVLGYALVGALAFSAVVVPVVLISLTFGQVALNHGGTDPQWFWFPSEPKGLEQLREDAAPRDTNPSPGHG